MSPFDRKLTEIERLVRNIRHSTSYVSRSQLVDLLARTADELRHASSYPDATTPPHPVKGEGAAGRFFA